MNLRLGLVSCCTILLATLASLVGASTVVAYSGPIFTVMNTSETPPDGVWFRRSPHTADTDRVTGHGVYVNERVQLVCYAWGDSVGAYSNRLWYFVLNVTRPTNAGVENSGYLNAHYINDGLVANQIDAGAPQCGAAPPPPPEVRYRSVFYSPNSTPTAFSGYSAADFNLPYGSWVAGNCSAARASVIPGLATQDVAATLSGWSIGRLGPIYYLSSAGSQRVGQVRTIVLFDPGNSSDMRASCDVRYDINSLLANWLRANGGTHLIVLTGQLSEEAKAGKSSFAGLWKYYFAGIWNQPFADRALVCDYKNLDHKLVFKYFSWMARNPVIGACPTDNRAPAPVAWHP
ncbi:MAG TPA: hypothetical protein VFA66_04365 [Gaiellaceae bacterium]|nr:hypothetical protein [Gaiellaceae bacterium]